MKYLKQFLIILAISMIGEILKYLLPLPVPASIYGMLILFVGLMTGIIRLESVREAGKFYCHNACYVYTGRCGSYGIMGSIKTCACPGEHNHGRMRIYGNGCERCRYTISYKD